MVGIFCMKIFMVKCHNYIEIQIGIILLYVANLNVSIPIQKILLLNCELSSIVFNIFESDRGTKCLDQYHDIDLK